MGKTLPLFLAAILIAALACGCRFSGSASLKSENSNGTRLVEAKNIRFERVLAAALGYGMPIKIEGDAAILGARVSGRCSGKTNSELIPQLEALGSCAIEMSDDGTTAIVHARTDGDSQPNR